MSGSSYIGRALDSVQNALFIEDTWLLFELCSFVFFQKISTYTQCFIGEIYCLLVMKFYSNYNFLISNFDNYSSNSMVRNYLDQNILHTYYNLGINGHPNETVTGAYNILCDVIHVQGKT